MLKKKCTSNILLVEVLDLCTTCQKQQIFRLCVLLFFFVFLFNVNKLISCIDFNTKKRLDAVMKMPKYVKTRKKMEPFLLMKEERRGRVSFEPTVKSTTVKQ